MKNPAISVVCPTYNSAEFIIPTIRSVFSQTVSPQEIIISDDGSSDHTIDIVTQMIRSAPCELRILQNPHKGPGAARNAGIRAAQGEWVAFLDSDDRWGNTKVQRVIEEIRTYPEVNFFCHDQLHQFLDGHQEPLNLAKRYQGMIPAKQLFRNCPFAMSAVTCRRDLLVTHGMFHEGLMSGQDFELWLRLIPHLRVHFIDEILGWYIDRRGNISSKKRLRHLYNILWALTYNRHNTTLRWYFMGFVRHISIFCKNHILKI